MAVSANPTFVFVPGFSHTPLFFEPLISQLEKYDFNGTSVAYPTMGYNKPPGTVDDEIAAVQDVIAEVVEQQQKDVVLFCHSYGGWPGSRAVRGWDKPTREKDGKKGGVVEMIVMAAFLPEQNANASYYSMLPPWIENPVRVSMYAVERGSKCYCNLLPVL